jgi:hypothetical protein
MITALVVGGLAILLAIVYVNHMLENAKLEKARLHADLTDRIRRIGNLSETLPGQLMTPRLKQLLTRLELQLSERLQRQDRQNRGLAERMSELRALLDQGDTPTVANAKQAVSSEAKAKDLRHQLEVLHAQLVRAAQEGSLEANEAKYWAKEIHHMLVVVYLELFTFVGQSATRQKRPRQARLAYERAVQYLQKQQDTERYRPLLEQFKAQLEAANALVLDTDLPAAEGETELTASLLENEDDWKKKAIYD